MSDILISAKAHDWYAHDETLAEELIDEIERLRAAATFALRAITSHRAMYAGFPTGALRESIGRLKDALGDVSDA